MLKSFCFCWIKLLDQKSHFLNSLLQQKDCINQIKVLLVIFHKKNLAFVGSCVASISLEGSISYLIYSTYVTVEANINDIIRSVVTVAWVAPDAFAFPEEEGLGDGDGAGLQSPDAYPVG